MTYILRERPVCCQNHDLEKHLKSFKRYSLFIKKLCLFFPVIESLLIRKTESTASMHILCNAKR